MAISTTDANIIDRALADNQKVGLGTEVKALQDRLATAEATIALLAAGKGITLPTSDPAVAGELWADTLDVKVSAGE
jgi:hypothetical protein